MSFDLQNWRAQLQARLTDWKPRMQRAGVNSVYAFISAAALWPVVEAYRQGDLTAVFALAGVVAGLGTNLLANQIQKWKDTADDESAAARQLAEAADDEALRAELDAVLEKLEALALAREALAVPDRAWFAETLRAELARLGNLAKHEGVVNIHLEGSQLSARDVTGRDKIAQQINAPVHGPVLGPGARLTVQTSRAEEAKAAAILPGD